MRKKIFRPLQFFIASILVLTLFNSKGVAQNLFDVNHTSAFADYLYESGQFKLAAEECERWLFLSPGNDSAALMLLRSYRKCGMYDIGVQKSELLLSSGKSFNSNQSTEFATLLMLNKNFSKADSFLNGNLSLTNSQADYLKMNKSLLMKNWVNAEQVFHNNGNELNPSFKPYASVFEDYHKLPHRSAALAMSMSTVIPGTGKFYTGDWKDAIFSMLLIGASGYQSYRGFQDKGTHSAYGWIFGGFGCGLYFGNIYGSYKAAKDFNHRHENELLKKAADLFSSNL